MAAATPNFVKASSDERFARALGATRRHVASKPPRHPVVEIRDPTGQAIAEIRASERDVKARLAKHTASVFAQFLTARLPELFEEFRSFGAGDGETKGP